MFDFGIVDFRDLVCLDSFERYLDIWLLLKYICDIVLSLLLLIGNIKLMGGVFVNVVVML